MKKSIHLRLDETVIKWLKKRGKLSNEIRKAIRLYKEGPRTITKRVEGHSEEKMLEEPQEPRWIKNQYDCVCSECGEPIRLAEIFLLEYDLKGKPVRTCVVCAAKEAHDVSDKLPPCKFRTIDEKRKCWCDLKKINLMVCLNRQRRFLLEQRNCLPERYERLEKPREAKPIGVAIYKRKDKTLPAEKTRCGYTRQVVETIFCQKECKYHGNCKYK